MGINLFKIINYNDLIYILENDYYNDGKEIMFDEFQCKFFFQQKTKNVNWGNILNIFSVNKTLKSISYNGVILIKNVNKEDVYAVSYGNAAYLVQKFSDVDFGFDFGKRIDLKELKRKSSTSQRNFGQKSNAITFHRTNFLDIRSGEIITSLSFSPVDEDNFGKRIDIGKSIKFPFDFDIELVINLIKNISNIIINNEIKNNLPVLVKVKNQNDIEDYNQKLFEIINEDYESGSINLDEMNIIGSSIYFSIDYNIYIKYNRKYYDIDHLDMISIYKISNENSFNLIDLIMKGQICYKDNNNVKIYDDAIYNYLNIDLNSERVTLFESNWYFYNDDFVAKIDEVIRRIEIIYDSNFDNIKNKVVNIKGLYIEDKINKYLATTIPNCINLDRKLYIDRYENEVYNGLYKIEIADLVINNNEFVSLKQGDDNKAFNYCFEQSEMALDQIIRDKYLINEIEDSNVKYISCWLFLKKIPMDKYNNINLTCINSIMLKRKISQWATKVFSTGLTPKIRINTIGTI